jgi:hypothetical protein
MTSTIICKFTAIVSILSVVLTGCTPHLHHDAPAPPPGTTQDKQLLRPTAFIVLFYRESSYKGAGRIHELHIDETRVGPLTAENYYRIELWEGDYLFSVHLPAEDFLGVQSLPQHTSMRISLRPESTPEILLFRYIDGEGIDRVESDGTAVITRIEHSRNLAASLTARDTAQVKYVFDARYDGPAKSGKAHGYGTLTWADGSIFQGQFEYGELTDTGKFFTTHGPVYLGPKRKGRPVGPGVWVAPAGRILYAGPFKEELPHGIGIRSGGQAPEFCVYEMGQDKTKTIFQLAEEAIDEEDKHIILDAQIPVAQGAVKTEVPPLPHIPSTADHTPSAGPQGSAQLNRGPVPSSTDSDLQNDASKRRAESGKGAAEAIPTREQRVSSKYKAIKQAIEKMLADKRDWCKDEFKLGRQLCECAPFAADFDRWNGCVGR